jgi:Lar family restriction alleviation protein
MIECRIVSMAENMRTVLPKGNSAATDPLRASPASAQSLRPCPFCGGSDVWINGDLDPKFVVCRKCWAFGPTAPTVTQAAERWNRRGRDASLK